VGVAEAVVGAVRTSKTSNSTSQTAIWPCLIIASLLRVVGAGVEVEVNHFSIIKRSNINLAMASENKQKVKQLLY
jgi:hypothetical protein